MNKRMSWLSFINISQAVQILAMAGLYWMGQHFVTLQKFESHEKQNTIFMDKSERDRESMRESLRMISLTLVKMDNQSKTLEDHEMRIRKLEMKP